MREEGREGGREKELERGTKRERDTHTEKESESLYTYNIVALPRYIIIILTSRISPTH